MTTIRFKETFQDIFGELYVLGGNNLNAIGEIEERLTALVENEIDSLCQELRDRTRQEFLAQGKAREIYEHEMQTLKNSFIFEKNAINQRHMNEIMALKMSLLEQKEAHQEEVDKLKIQIAQWQESYQESATQFSIAYDEKEHQISNLKAKLVPAEKEQISFDCAIDLDNIHALKF